jgi:hypothetical protein
MAKAQEALGYEHGLVDYERYDIYTGPRAAGGRVSNAGVVGVKARHLHRLLRPRHQNLLPGATDYSLPAGLSTRPSSKCAPPRTTPRLRSAWCSPASSLIKTRR